jgi:hypothetical protein
MLSRVTLIGSSAVLAFVGVVACTAKTAHPPASETSSSGGGGGQGGSSGTVGDGGLADGGGCNALSLANAAIIGQQQIAEAAPVPIGGAIPDGVYSLAKDTIFTGPGGTTAATGVTTQEVQSFSGTNFDILSQAAAPAAELSGSGSYAVTSTTNDAGTTIGSTLTISLACPSPTTVVRSYSVVNGTILEFIGANEVLTYTLLP